MVLRKDWECPCWDGLQPSAGQLLCDKICAFQKPTDSIPWNAKMMNLNVYDISTAERTKTKCEISSLNKFKVKVIW